jgi:hypothetical protein
VVLVVLDGPGPSRGADQAVDAPGGAPARCDIQVAGPAGTKSAPTSAGRIQLGVRDAGSRARVSARADEDPRGGPQPWETLALMPQEWERRRPVSKTRVDDASARSQRLLERAPASSSAGPLGPAAPLIASGTLLFVVRRRGPPRPRGR